MPRRLLRHVFYTLLGTKLEKKLSHTHTPANFHTPKWDIWRHTWEKERKKGRKKERKRNFVKKKEGKKEGAHKELFAQLCLYKLSRLKVILIFEEKRNT